jgi:hypothetical protein
MVLLLQTARVKIIYIITDKTMQINAALYELLTLLVLGLEHAFIDLLCPYSKP